MIVFRKRRKTKGFDVYKSDDYECIGDFTQIYVRNDCDAAKHIELTLIPLTEYNRLVELWEEKYGYDG